MMNRWKAIDRQEVCRYLGVRGAHPDKALSELIDRAIDNVTKAASPRCVSRTMPASVKDGVVTVGALAIRSADLARHLDACDEVIVFGATLGSGVDRLLQRDTLMAPALAVTEQAAAAALMEMYADERCRDLASPYEETGRWLRPRYSPGYGDFSLEYQPLLLQLLDANKRIGLTATAAHMLTPMKSITALIGVSTQKRACYTGGCAMCGKRDCLFRKEEIV